MKAWSLRISGLAALVALLVWVWQAWFPSPERVIRRRLAELARLASFEPNEGALAKLLNPQKLAGFFTSDVEVRIEAFGYGREFSGRDQVQQAAMAARSALQSLKLKFPDIDVAMGPDQKSAVVNLTASGQTPSERDGLIYELKLIFEKVGNDWLIRRVEPVKTLMQAPFPGRRDAGRCCCRFVQFRPVRSPPVV